MLAELGEDLSAPKVAYGINPATGKMVRPRGISPGGLAGLRTGVERCLKERDTRFVVIDGRISNRLALIFGQKERR